MPGISPGLNQWFTPAIIVAVVALLITQLVNQLSRRIDELSKRIDDLREENNKQNDNLRSDMKDGFNKLEAKVDRLIESRLPTSPRQ